MKYLSLLILLLASTVEAGECLVTSSGGGFEEGSLLTHMRNPNCTTIRFQNGIQEIKLKSILEITGGTQLIGNPGVSLRYDPDHPWPADEYKDCLLRVVPLTPHFSTAPVKISNLTLTNFDGMGICFKKQNGRIVTGDGLKEENLLQNLVIHVGTIGIDLQTANWTQIKNVTIDGQGDEDSVGIRIVREVDANGIATAGVGNNVLQSTFRQLDVGVKTGQLAGTILEQNQYLEIGKHPVVGLEGVPAPTDIRFAFVHHHELTLTGEVIGLPLSMEVYKVSTSNGGGRIRKNYNYLTTITEHDFLPRDPRTANSRLGAFKRRFLLVLSSAQLRPEESVVVNSRYFPDGTRNFSDIYSGASVAERIQGHSRCNDVGWFWLSFDRKQRPDDPSLNRAWTYDYDEDFVTNGAEDLNRDCWFDRGERDPEINDDIDGDGVLHNRYETDNCPTVINTQEDQDRDGIGDACDVGDVDGDGFDVQHDNCRTVHNPDQRNSDTDGFGDACQERIPPYRSISVEDTDGDDISTARDNCPFDKNADQSDLDGDGVGDVCDPDDENDGLADKEEMAGFASMVETEFFGIRLTNPRNPDTDLDGFCDGPGMGFYASPCVRPLDNCPLVINRDQLDRDEDGIGDVCDTDIDSDGDRISDEIDQCPNHFDGHAWDFDHNSVVDGVDAGIYAIDPLLQDLKAFFNTHDDDFDGVGDACDSDDDNDGLDDMTESGIFNPRRKNPQGHFSENHLNHNVDNDSYADGIDPCVNVPTSNAEMDIFMRDPKGYIPPDRCGNYPANDLDGDGIENLRDNCRLVPNRFQIDLDGDGLGDACDLDDDNDDHLTEEVISLGGVDVDPCFFYLHQSLIDPALMVKPYIIARHDGKTPRTERNDGLGCSELLIKDLPPPNTPFTISLRSLLEGCLRTCDFDESANFRLHPWDPNSDHYNGRVFGFADQKCDGAGTGFGGASGIFVCKPADFCPEYYNRADSQNVCSPAFTPALNVPDRDNDGVPDDSDNCPDVPNGDQSDIDGDRAGDLCDDDIDGDFAANAGDNCPYIYNPDQTNLDDDDFGDACDPNPPLNISTTVQGGGCRIAIGRKFNFGIFSLILASIGLIGVIRQRA